MQVREIEGGDGHDGVVRVLLHDATSSQLCAMFCYDGASGDILVPADESVFVNVYIRGHQDRQPGLQP